MIKEQVDLAHAKRSYCNGTCARRRVLESIVQITIIISAAAWWYYTNDIIIPLFIMMIRYLFGTILRSKKRILELELQLAEERCRSSIIKDA